MGSILDKQNTAIARRSCEIKSQDLRNPKKSNKTGIFILFIKGDHKKLNATTKPPKDSSPMSDKSSPSTRSHLDKAAPVTKYGNEADIPKKIKLSGSFLNISNPLPVKIFSGIKFSSWRYI